MAYQYLSSPPAKKFQTINLEAATHQSIMEALGDIATGRFTCGGTLCTPPKVQLNYLNKMGIWSGATFPGLENADFQQILESSTVASFGKGKETVTDKSYRDAYALDPEKFLTSFQLSDTVILGEVRLLLVPDVLNIRAELYKMNIYTAPTGCFKAHVDTPHGGNMFGSLVVCLPSQFTGGTLVTRHNGQQVVYDWSLPVDDPVQSIRWAAFFSDVEHEILPVTEGHRVTLTYNLYHCDHLNQVPTVVVTTSLFYKNLKIALDHPHFLRDGGVLGFACQHAYVFQEFAITWKEVVDVMDDLPIEKSILLTKLQKLGKYADTVLKVNKYKLSYSITDDIGLTVEEYHKAMNHVSRLRRSLKGCLLKGSDRTVLLAGKSLGLKVEVKPIINHPDEEDKYFIGNDFEFRSAYVARDEGWGEPLGWDNYMKSERNDDASHVTWCQKLSYWQPAIAALVCGNDSSLEMCYQAAAILVSIPTWSERCGVVSST